MITINVTDGNDKKTLRAAEGLSLLEALRINGYDIYAPCGGRGTCNKCIVEVEGEGTVLSCNYYSNKDIEIILPGRDEEQILTNQTEFLHDLPMDADIFPVSAVPANSDTPSAPAASDSKGVHAGAATPPTPAPDSKGVQAEPAAPENTQPLFAPGGSHVMNPFGVAVDLGT
ncbi:MAG TPA: 2Fe-2S iron-sulfur cluster-binding protein, partial [Bacteroidales bacterium]|nr:2Fe-2S iron-sulfur cluster-binding protein [Bacteroidales bacterium]